MIRFVCRHAFAILLTLAVVGLVSTCLVLPNAYVHWVDDVMINEYGRLPIGFHRLEWNMNWFPIAIRNEMSSPFYLGGAMLDIGYRLWGEKGPRFLVFGFFAVASTLLYFYLLKKCGNRVLSLAMALLYFSYPSLPVSVRGARVDVVAMCFVLAALNVLAIRTADKVRQAAKFFAAGVLCTMGMFTWFSATLMAPLVMWEVYEEWRQCHLSWKRLLSLMICALLGCAVAFAVIAAPFYGRIDKMFAYMFLSVSNGASVAGNRYMFREFLELFFSFPGFFAVGLTMLLFSKRIWIVSVGTWVLIAMCIPTNFYINRIIYFLPAAMLGVAVFVCDCKSVKLRKMVCVVVGIMIALSYMRTCVFRNMTDWHSRPLRNYAEVQDRLEAELGRGCRIYNYSYQLYYVGRNLGWRQFRARGWTPIPPDELYPLFDHYICEEKDVTPELEESLASHGFKTRGIVYNPPRQLPTAFGQLLHRTGRIVPCLGSYRVYDRKTSPTSTAYQMHSGN